MARGGGAAGSPPVRGGGPRPMPRRAPYPAVCRPRRRGGVRNEVHSNEVHSGNRDRGRGDAQRAVHGTGRGWDPCRALRRDDDERHHEGGLGSDLGDGARGEPEGNPGSDPGAHRGDDLGHHPRGDLECPHIGCTGQSLTGSRRSPQALRRCPGRGVAAGGRAAGGRRNAGGGVQAGGGRTRSRVGHPARASRDARRRRRGRGDRAGDRPERSRTTGPGSRGAHRSGGRVPRTRR